MVLNQEQQGELERLNKVLDVAKRNGNQLFIENIEREIAAIERGEHSPLIADYLTEEERSGKRPGLLPWSTTMDSVLVKLGIGVLVDVVKLYRLLLKSLAKKSFSVLDVQP